MQGDKNDINVFDDIPVSPWNSRKLSSVDSELLFKNWEWTRGTVYKLNEFSLFMNSMFNFPFILVNIIEIIMHELKLY